MIITDKSDVFQKLLQDVEDIKIAVMPMKSRYSWGCDPPKSEEKDTLKKGDWVVRTKGSDGDTFFPGRIFKILDILYAAVYETPDITHWIANLRKATNDEIKNHLIKASREKGLLPLCRFKWGDYDGDITTFVPGGGYEYLANIDVLTVAICERETRRAIYDNGKWATPVYCKPTLVSRTDFIQFLTQYEEKVMRGELTMREFLNLYDIK